ncbi:hypothetical protein [Virgibacillus pantothenticus]|uniref:hypothetical protein n=1 Tax=Virgibacillus pantothenticus TaxID=1473 RepID=UPI001C22EEFC|nr:hypothetical protein [Virgibacillus pantothenticus]MBU8643292.1 hypothetical protein [Virgibacillus pantothenticus]
MRERKKKYKDIMKTVLIKYPETRRYKIIKALWEVESIRTGKLPERTARDFLNDPSSK